MMSIGESTGTLDSQLDLVANNYYEKVDYFAENIALVYSKSRQRLSPIHQFKFDDFRYFHDVVKYFQPWQCRTDHVFTALKSC